MPRVISHHGYTAEELEGTSKWALFFPGDSMPHGIADADGLTP